MENWLSGEKLRTQVSVNTPDRRQSKTLLKIDERRSKIAGDRQQSKTLILSTNIHQKSLETVFLIAICRQSGDKWQSKTLFLTIFYLRSWLVLTISIDAYPV